MHSKYRWNSEQDIAEDTGWKRAYHLRGQGWLGFNEYTRQNAAKLHLQMERERERELEITGITSRNQIQIIEGDLDV